MITPVSCTSNSSLWLRVDRSCLPCTEDPDEDGELVFADDGGAPSLPRPALPLDPASTHTVSRERTLVRAHGFVRGHFVPPRNHRCPPFGLSPSRITHPKPQTRSQTSTLTWPTKCSGWRKPPRQGPSPQRPPPRSAAASRPAAAAAPPAPMLRMLLSLPMLPLNLIMLLLVVLCSRQS